MVLQEARLQFPLASAVNSIIWYATEVMRAVILSTPTSASAERVFSIMTNTFDDNQKRTLDDSLAYSLQRQYNVKKRAQEDETKTK